MSKEPRFIEESCTQVKITNDVGDPSLHLLESEERDAINAALAINRPLLVWGDPGLGKSQLAKAAAEALDKVFIPFVADAHTESRDLLWSLDSVARLAEAQLQNPEKPDREAVKLKNFIIPGALWWALNWNDADRFVKTKDDNYRYSPPRYSGNCHPKKGVVVLIDEIDKADSSVPNGLLEALGSGRFQPQGLDHPVEASGVKPLVIITTNRERNLPDAFVRRCLSLHLKFPDSEDGEDKPLKFLLDRARLNFSELDEGSVLKPAAKMLLADRAQAAGKHLRPLPGLAEYFDLLRGVRGLMQDGVEVSGLLEKLQRFTYQKHPEFPRESYKE